MKKFSLTIFSALLLIACAVDSDWKLQEVNDFTMEIPTSWTMVEVQGYDSFVQQIRINGQEVVHIDLGWYSNKLNVDPATHTIQFKTIDARTAKLVQPKNFQAGTTGVYFDQIDESPNRLNVRGENLSAVNQRLLLNAIETIRFK